MPEVEFVRSWRTRWDLLVGDPERERYFAALHECEGAGNCHGCLGWCAICGDVSNVCHVRTWPERCDEHQRYPEPPPPPDPSQLQFVFAETLPACLHDHRLV